MTTSVKTSVPPATATASGIFKNHNNSPDPAPKNTDTLAYALKVPPHPYIGSKPKARVNTR